MSTSPGRGLVAAEAACLRLVREAEDWPYPPDRARQAATEILERLRDASGSGQAGHEQVADLVVDRTRRLLS